MGNFISAKKKKMPKCFSEIIIPFNSTDALDIPVHYSSSNHIEKQINQSEAGKQLKCQFSKKTKVRALYNFDPSNDSDLKFKKGDLLLVSCNAKESWWQAEHVVTHETGFIPRNYVVINDGSPESHDGFFKIGRIESEKKLILPGFEEGTYIVRPMIHQRCYALSIRVFDSVQQYFVVKHYKIRSLPNGHFFIIQKKHFTDITSLLIYYSRHADDLCCRLKRPFPKIYKPPIQFRDIQVNRNCIKLYKKIGSGKFGCVWLAKWNQTIDVAVKTLRGNAMDQSQRDIFLDEARLLHKLHHPRIVEILGTCSEPIESPVFIITEYMPKGSLVNFLHSDEGKTLVLTDMLLMMTQIADGMSYLESENFIHRDLRASNVLVAEDLSVKVADFGLAGVVKESYGRTPDSKFPIRWTAPEAGLRQKFSIKSDVWSFGVLIYEIVTYGQIPYAGMQIQEILCAIDRGFRLEQPCVNNLLCPTELYDIMKSCWEANPERRPTFRHLKDLFENYRISTEQGYQLTKT